METAFRASSDGAAGGADPSASSASTTRLPAVRPDGRTDAVHTCGHGPIAGGVTAAALALASASRQSSPGTVIVIGCPSDEIHAPGTIVRGGGKALTADAGVWDGWTRLCTRIRSSSTPSRSSRAGCAARRRSSPDHAARGADQPPMQAASAALEEARKHVPDNVMLERLRARRRRRGGDGARDEGDLSPLRRRGAGGGGGANGGSDSAPGRDLGDRSTVRGGPTRRARDRRRRRCVPGARAATSSPIRHACPFATDFGNISRRCPAALIGVGRQGGWKFHTDEGAEEFASADGVAAATTVAQVLALAALEILDPAGA